MIFHMYVVRIAEKFKLEYIRFVKGACNILYPLCIYLFLGNAANRSNAVIIL